MKHGKYAGVLLVSFLCGLLLSCKSGSPTMSQDANGREAGVSQKRVPLLDSSQAAFDLVTREFKDGRIRFTPYANYMGINLRGCCSGMTGLPLGTPGEHCDTRGCIGASCPSHDMFGVTILLNDVNGELYQLGYCVDKYTGDINAYNDLAFSLTMRGNHSAWGPI